MREALSREMGKFTLVNVARAILWTALSLDHCRRSNVSTTGVVHIIKEAFSIFWFFSTEFWNLLFFLPLISYVVQHDSISYVHPFHFFFFVWCVSIMCHCFNVIHFLIPYATIFLVLQYIMKYVCWLWHIIFKKFPVKLWEFFPLLLKLDSPKITLWHIIFKTFPVKLWESFFPCCKN